MRSVDGHSLRAALDAWRADRTSVFLANCVDDAAARVSRVEPPAGKIHRWWTDQATAYDPVTATTLLATVTTQAAQAHTSWRVIFARATPLVDRLRAAGVKAEDKERPEWLNLVDRIGLMLAWPDDPRVAVALARLLWNEPFRGDRYRMRRRFVWQGVQAVCGAAIVHRICEIGDLRALEMVTHVWSALDANLQALVNTTVDEAPPSRTTHHVGLDTAWHAVVADPFDLQTRLVLADAYLERGDPRGDMMVQQCRPLIAIEKARAAGEEFDPSGLYGESSNSAMKLIENNWHHWLGDVALVATRGSRFQGGLLHDVVLGHGATPTWAWDRIVDHRELCAIHRLSAGHERHHAAFADFLCARKMVPRWVHLDQRVLAILRARTRTLALTGVSLSLYQGDFDQLIEAVLSLAPGLERLNFDLVGPYYLSAIRALALRAPHLKLSFAAGFHIDEAVRATLDELRVLPNVKVLNYGV